MLARRERRGQALARKAAARTPEQVDADTARAARDEKWGVRFSLIFPAAWGAVAAAGVGTFLGRAMNLDDTDRALMAIIPAIVVAVLMGRVTYSAHKARLNTGQ